MIKLHLGCGRIVIPGWTNIDQEPWPGVQTADLRKPLLAFRDGSVDFIFHEHFLEHLTRVDGLAFLRDCHRMLKPGGVMRIATPDLDTLIDDYYSGRLDRISRDVWAPATPCQMLNEAMRQWGHQFIYDHDELRLILNQAGFANVTFCAYHRSEHLDLAAVEQRPDCGEIMIAEATKG